MVEKIWAHEDKGAPDRMESPFPCGHQRLGAPSDKYLHETAHSFCLPRHVEPLEASTAYVVGPREGRHFIYFNLGLCRWMTWQREKQLVLLSSFSFPSSWVVTGEAYPIRGGTRPPSISKPTFENEFG